MHTGQEHLEYFVICFRKQRNGGGRSLAYLQPIMSRQTERSPRLATPWTLGTIVLLTALAATLWVRPGQPALLAGASATDVSPRDFPVIVNGGFLSKTATQLTSPLSVRWLVLDDGGTRIALGVLDTCVIPREFADDVKARGHEVTGIPPERISISATHTHSAPSLMRVLGTDPDPRYPAFVLPLVVEGLRRAAEQMVPARVGWTSICAPAHTHTRVWVRRPDKMLSDPFGEITARANMHPGYQNPDVVAPSGPSDPEMTLLSVQSRDGSPIAVLANFAMHYFGAPPVSADYFGLFCAKFARLVGDGEPPSGFVAIMSQGFSGDQHWMDYGSPKKNIAIGAYADEIAGLAFDAYRRITYHDRAPIGAAAKALRIATRQPDQRRLEWARAIVAAMGDRPPKNQPEVYAREQLWLMENPERVVPLQAFRVGDLGITMTPCEVFAISGLKIKAQSPMPLTMNIELANGEEGYIPPAELHPLGGYNTWACRSAGLEPRAESQIVHALLGLLEDVSGQPRSRVAVQNGPYAHAVVADKPHAYWRLEEFDGPTAGDATGTGPSAAYERGVALYLDGPPAPAFSGPGAINRAALLAGGRIAGGKLNLGRAYTAEFWFWNGLPADVRPVTGFLFGRDAAETLAIGGTSGHAGRLVLTRGPSPPLPGRTEIGLRTWNHVAVVRDGPTITVYLNGGLLPEIVGEIADTPSGPAATIFIGGQSDPANSLEGKVDEIAIYARALAAEEIRAHYTIAAADPAGTTAR